MTTLSPQATAAASPKAPPSKPPKPSSSDVDLLKDLLHKSGGPVEFVPFGEDVVECVQAEDGKVYVPIRRICQNLGIDTTNQVKKLRDFDASTSVMITAVGLDGKNREMACVDIDHVPLWLARINPSKVIVEVRPKLRKYQLEVQQVLRDHFYGKKPTPAQPKIEPTATNLLLDAPTVPVRRLYSAEEREDLYFTTVQSNLETLRLAYDLVHKSRNPNPVTLQRLEHLVDAVIQQRPIETGYRPDQITLDVRLAQRGLTATDRQKYDIRKYIPRAFQILSNGHTYKPRSRHINYNGTSRKTDYFDATDVRVLDAAINYVLFGEEVVYDPSYPTSDN